MAITKRIRVSVLRGDQLSRQSEIVQDSRGDGKKDFILCTARGQGARVDCCKRAK